MRPRTRLTILATALAWMLSACTVTPPATTHTPAASGSSAAPSPATGQGSDLEGLFIDAPDTYQQIPDTRSPDLGYESRSDVEKALPSEKAEFDKDGFQYGWIRVWTRPRLAIYVRMVIVRYGSAQGARDITAYADNKQRTQAAADKATVAPLSAPGAPGSLSLIINDTKANTASYIVSMFRGPLHATLYIDAPLTPLTDDDDPAVLGPLAVRLATAQYNLLPA